MKKIKSNINAYHFDNDYPVKLHLMQVEDAVILAEILNYKIFSN
ncbi:MAG: hypothetical protein RAO94_08515 [Candidatus Stygibacter australis]|nr:hypothetical protein [Candidatus Stygibacter australis]MDP8322377.1 hypothetical protein [Candidatus Stygibacter australis]